MITIIKPLGCGGDIDFAAEELKLFLGKYDDVECGKSASGNEIFISLGNTELAGKADVAGKTQGLSDYGFAIETIKNGYYIVSPTEKGVSFGVYSLLKELCDLEIYAEDEIYSADGLTPKPVHKKENPSFDYFDSSWVGWNKYSPTFAHRRRLRIAPFITPFHSFFEILPKTEYLREHRDWYSEDYGQLCLTNEEMAEEFIKNCFKFIDRKAFRGCNVSNLMVGQEDNGDFCRCEKCRESYEKYGLTGTLMRFVNKVSKAVDDYVGLNYAGKTIRTVTFAYGATQFPPVDENYKPIDPSVVPAKNVVILTAPISADFTKSLNDETANPNSYRLFKGYEALGAEMYVWVYNSAFDDQFMYFSQWDALKENFRFCRSINTRYVIDMGNPLPDLAFDALTVYVRTKLAWNIDLDENKLIDDFFAAYYRESAPYVRKYFDESNALQREKNEGKHNHYLYVQQNRQCKSADYWEFDKVLSWAELLREGEKAAKTPPVALRVAVQKLTPLYMLLEIHHDRFTKGELKKMIEEFEVAARNSFVRYAEETGVQYMRDVYGKIVKWRSLLLP